MKVLLTNDDGISATGLSAMRRALLELPGIELAVIAPDSNRSRHRAQHHDPSSALGRGVRLRRRHQRIRHGRHAGRLRALRRAGADRLRAGADRLGHQPRLEPGRRHHLLRHGRRGARGHRARHPGDRGLAAGRPRARWTSAPPAPGRARTSRRRPRSRRGSSRSSSDVPMPAGTLLNVNCPAGEIAGARATRLGKRIYNDRHAADRGGGRAAGATASTASGRLPARGRHRLRRDGGRLHRRHAHPLRPDRPSRRGEARRLRPRRAARAGRAGS